MASRKPGAWHTLQSVQQKCERESAEYQAEVRARQQPSMKHPKYWLHLIGLALLMTQSKFVIDARGADGNNAWIVGMLLALASGAVVAGVWHFAKRPTKAQTGRHFVYVSWVVAALSVFGSHQ